jgi:nitrogen regulatory protein PII
VIIPVLEFSPAHDVSIGAAGELFSGWSDGSEYTVDFLPKLKLKLVVADADLNGVINAVVESAKTGKIGDGKVFVVPIEQAIRTEEKGEDAV